MGSVCVCVCVNSNWALRSSFPISLKLENHNLRFNTPTSTLRSSLLPPSDSTDSHNRTLQDYNLGVKAALAILTFYKREISPILPKSCRYIPTCSEYSMEAYKRYGVIKGTLLTTCRICRCNPLGGTGYDPPRWFGEITPTQQIDD